MIIKISGAKSLEIVYKRDEQTSYSCFEGTTNKIYYHNYFVDVREGFNFL